MATKELFLSYGREEGEVNRFVKRLKDDLEKSGFGVWLDTDSIAASDNWREEIGTGLHDCKALLAVITNKYISSRYCTDELYLVHKDEKFIFPLIFEEVDFDATERGRGVKYALGSINYVQFRSGKDDYDASLQKLTEGLRKKGELYTITGLYSTAG